MDCLGMNINSGVFRWFSGFGVIFLHANEIIMSALSGYQKQAFISSRDVVLAFVALFQELFDVCTLF